MKLERHADGRGHNSPHHLHVGKDPLVAGRGDAEVALEQRVQPVQEEVHSASVREDSTVSPNTPHTQYHSNNNYNHNNAGAILAKSVFP